MARKPSQRVPKAYDYRRAILLVQLLAQAGSGDVFLDLCEKWGVEPAYNPPDENGYQYLYIWGTLSNLAKHAIEYSREQVKNMEDKHNG